MLISQPSLLLGVEEGMMLAEQMLLALTEAV